MYITEKPMMLNEPTMTMNVFNAQAAIRAFFSLHLKRPMFC